MERRSWEKEPKKSKKDEKLSVRRLRSNLYEMESRKKLSFSDDTKTPFTSSGQSVIYFRYQYWNLVFDPTAKSKSNPAG